MRKGQPNHIICFILTFLLMFMNVQVFASPVVHVSKVSINKTTDTLVVGQTDIIRATFTPANTTNRGVKWTSSNTTIATVDIWGKVMTLKPRTVTITGVTVDKGLKISCEVTAKNTTNSTTNKPSGKLINNTSDIKNDSQKILITNIFNLAKQGKVINSDFPAKTTTIDTVCKKLGKADKIDYVAKAKGNYATFAKYKLVFGFNKGSQIFEVRTFDSKISKVSLSMVKNTLGSPAYDVKSNGQEIIGYKAGQEYKLLLVFNDSSKSNSDPLIDHYSVLYPKGTVNSMANDSGREW